LNTPDGSGIAPLRHDDGAAVFAEPWQAQILALADTLARSGLFTPAAWSEALGGALRHAESHGAPDTPATYYAAAVEALEGLLTASGTIGADALAARREEWRQAHLATPHGQPVELKRD
jgi:nitrile hydratase accessory protein